MQIRGYKIRLPLDVMLVRLGQPGGLHEPRPDHHAAEGPLRRPDPHALPARGRDRDGDRRAGGAAARRRRGRRRARARVHDRDRRRRSRSWPARARTSTSAPACRCASRSPTTRRWSPTPCGGPCGSARTSSCPASATSTRWPSSTGGKVEIESLEDGRDGEIVDRLLKAAVLTVFKERCGTERVREVLAAFESGTIVHAGDDVASADYVELFSDVTGAADRRRRSHRRRREPGRGRQRHRVRARGPAPLEAAQQGRRRRPGHLPQPVAPVDGRARSPTGRCMSGYGLAEGDEGMLPWSWAEERLTRSHDYWCATTWPDGRPHVMPVWAVWLDEALWFSSAPTSHGRRATSAVTRAASSTTDDALEPVVLEGRAGAGRAILGAHRDVHRRRRTPSTRPTTTPTST